MRAVVRIVATFLCFVAVSLSIAKVFYPDFEYKMTDITRTLSEPPTDVASSVNEWIKGTFNRDLDIFLNSVKPQPSDGIIVSFFKNLFYSLVKLVTSITSAVMVLFGYVAQLGALVTYLFRVVISFFFAPFIS